MRLIHKMLFSYDIDSLEFEERWNALATKKSNRMIAGAVAIWEDDPDLIRLQYLFESARQTGVSLESTEIEAVYSEEDLFACEIVTLEFGGLIRLPPQSLGTALKPEEACHLCHRSLLKQVGILDLPAAKHRGDAFVIMVDCKKGLLTIARAVSQKFWNVIESLQLKGVDKRELKHQSQDPSTRLHQLIIRDSAPELHQTAKIEKLRICERCGEPMEVYRQLSIDTRDEELVFPRFDFRHKPLVHTREVFGGHTIKTDGNRDLIASGSLYRELMKAGIKNLAASPAHLL